MLRILCIFRVPPRDWQEDPATPPQKKCYQIFSPDTYKIKEKKILKCTNSWKKAKKIPFYKDAQHRFLILIKNKNMGKITFFKKGTVSEVMVDNTMVYLNIRNNHVHFT